MFTSYFFDYTARRGAIEGRRSYAAVFVRVICRILGGYGIDLTFQYRFTMLVGSLVFRRLRIHEPVYEVQEVYGLRTRFNVTGMVIFRDVSIMSVRTAVESAARGRVRADRIVNHKDRFLAVMIVSVDVLLRARGRESKAANQINNYLGVYRARADRSTRGLDETEEYVRLSYFLADDYNGLSGRVLVYVAGRIGLNVFRARVSFVRHDSSLKRGYTSVLGYISRFNKVGLRVKRRAIGIFLELVAGN